ncbi:MAG: hypothetical protein PHX18_07565 [Candidatus Gastranaerophilales bacterium]|nr:hypothetical protein [Candidatus Gastranaerophilales bacterium]
MNTTFLLTQERATIGNNLTQGGNGKHKPLRKVQKKENKGEFDPFNPVYDRMHFKNARDPIYLAFDNLDRQPVTKLAADFIKDGIKSSVSTIGSKLVSIFQ